MNWVRAVVFGGGLIVAFGVASAADFDQLLKAKIAKIEKGQRLTQEEKDECHNQFQNYREELAKKYGTDKIVEWSPEDQARHYVNTVTLAVIDFERHGGWPVKHAGMRESYPFVKEMLEEHEESRLMVALIVPALYNNNEQLAVSTYNKLAARCPLMADFIRDYVQKYCHFCPAGTNFLGKVVNPGSKVEESTNSAANPVSSSKALPRRP